MTTRRKPSKALLSLAAMAVFLSPFASAAQRAATYAEAREKAGDEGIVVFCYGPDWSKRSVRMLKSFWENPVTEEAAGNAVMLAVPYYQSNASEGAENAGDIRGGLPSPPEGICPAVMMLDKTGRVYATLSGADYLGDENGELGAQNMKAKLDALRRHNELMAQAATVDGVEKARLLGQASDLGIEDAKKLLQEIEALDPNDQSGMVRRNKHSALQFMYKLLETPDGFVKTDFVPNMVTFEKECMAIVDDESYRMEDRQAAYCLYIGMLKNAGESPRILKGHILKVKKMDETSSYGILCDSLMEKWGSGSSRSKSPEERKAEREAKKKADKAEREKKMRDRKAARDAEVN